MRRENVLQITKSLSSLMVGATFVLGSLAGPRPAEAATEFIFAHAVPKDHFVHTVSLAFIDKLKELSDGKLVVEYHPGGDLGDWTTQFEQVMHGAFPMTITWAASEFDRRLNLSFLGYVADDWSEAREVYRVDGPMDEIYQQIFDDLNMKFIGAIPVGYYGLGIRKGTGVVPVNYPEDCKGLKIRVSPVAIAVKRFEALGCSPVVIPFSELYTALQLGTVDGRAFAPPGEIWLHRDVLETYVFLHDAFETAVWLANSEWWERLTPTERNWIEAAASHALNVAWAEAEKSEKGFVEKLNAQGIKVVELSPDQLAKVKTLVYENEWKWMEAEVGKDLMDKVKSALGR